MPRRKDGQTFVQQLQADGIVGNEVTLPMGSYVPDPSGKPKKRVIQVNLSDDDYQFFARLAAREERQLGVQTKRCLQEFRRAYEAREQAKDRQTILAERASGAATRITEIEPNGFVKSPER